MSVETMPAERATCHLCDADDVLDIGLCPDCVGTDMAKRHLVFAKAARHDPYAMAKLSRLLDASGFDSMRAIRSGRPLVAVPAGASTHVVPALEHLGLTARSLPLGDTWKALPSHFWVMLACMFGVGMLAGFVTAPSFLWMSPVLALSLLFVGQRSLQKPLLAAGDTGLDPDLCADVISTMLSLHPRDPRDRLVDLVRIARPLLRELQARGDSTRVRDSVQNLVRTACETARETDRLRHSADVIRSTLVWTPEVAGEERADSARSVLLRCSDLARRGVAQLGEAVVALGRVDAKAADRDGPVLSELAALTRDLEAAARIHAETFRELNRLMS